MQAKGFYLALCVAGTVLPCWQFLPFLTEHGLDLRLFFAQLFANPVSGFFGMDVIVSSVVLWVLVVVDGRRAGVNASLGPDCGKPGGRCVAGIAAVPLHARAAAREGRTMRRLSATRAIVLGTLVVGVLDALDAVVFFGLWAGVHADSDLPGHRRRAARSGARVQGGLGTAVLGACLHFFIAFVIVTIYYAASRRARILTDRPVIFGLLYGVAVYFVMSRIVVPLSAAGGGGTPPLPVLVNGLLIHALGVGLPSALFARAARPSPYGSVRRF